MAALAITALAIRLELARQPPFDFAVMRQHHSALIAANVFYRSHPDAAPGWRRRTAAAYVAQATIPEPIVAERLAAAAYTIAGRESLTFPRALSGLLWIAGGLCLFGAVRRWSSAEAALLAFAVFAFVPYTFRASVTLQPDPMAVSLVCAALYGLSRANLDVFSVTTGAAAAAAILVRPMTALVLVPVAIGLTSRRPGAASRNSLMLFLLAALVPFVAYFATRMMADPTYASRIGGTFAPALLLDLGFYRGWARNIWLAFGSIVFAAAFLGALVAPPGPLRTAVRAMWGGYVLYGLGFNLHVSTHPYYQTIAVPMVACSVAALAQRYAKSAAWSFWLGPALAVVLLIIAWGQGVFPSPPAAARIAEFQAIGESVEHSDRVVFLSEDWGTPLRYYGGLAGRYWPTRFEIQMYRPLGEGGLSDEAALLRWTDLSKSLGGARYFVVTDIPELARQPDLQRLLGERFALRQKTDHYLVYEASQ